mgnify:FL=1
MIDNELKPVGIIDIKDKFTEIPIYTTMTTYIFQRRPHSFEETARLKMDGAKDKVPIIVSTHYQLMLWVSAFTNKKFLNVVFHNNYIGLLFSGAKIITFANII